MTWNTGNQWNGTKDWKKDSGTDWNSGGWDKPTEGQWGKDSGHGDSLVEKISLVKKCLQTVQEHNKWSDSTQDLLVFAVDNALGIPKHARHDVQSQLITMIKAGVAAYKEVLETKQEEHSRAYEQFDEECQTASKQIETLDEELGRLEASQAEVEEKLQQEQNVMASLKEEEDNAREEVNDVHLKSKELKEKIIRTVHIYEREFLPMKKDYKAHGRLEKITAQLEKLGAEEVLLKCIDVSLRSADRGELSLAAISMAEKLFISKLEELRTEDRTIDCTDLPKAKRHLESATNALDQQREKVQQCEKKVEESKLAKADTFLLKERAQKCIDDPYSYHKELQEELEAAESAVQEFAKVEEALVYIEENASASC